MNGEAPQKALAFSREEYEQRVASVQQALGGRGLDALVVTTPENIYYLTGHQTPAYYVYQAVVVPARGQPTIAIRHGEVANSRLRSWVDDDRYAPFDERQSPAEATREALRWAGVGVGRIGVELKSWFLTAANYLDLRELLSGGELVDASDTVAALRLIKSPAEVDYIRQAARTVEAGMRAGLAAVEAGRLDNVVASEILRALVAAGSEYVGLWPFVCTGLRSSTMHATWERNTIRPGDVVLLEIGGAINRYHAALFRTAFVGDPPDEVRRLLEASERANAAALAAIRPGVTAEAVHRALMVSLEETGHAELRRGARSGYSIGIAFAPDWGELHILSLDEGEQRTLEPGMVLHVPTALRLPGRFGIAHSETVLVTEGGCELITDFPTGLFAR